MFQLLLVGAFSGLGLAQSSTAATAMTGAPTSTQSLAPCGQISSILASYAAASPSATIPALLDVGLAQACQSSVPINQDDATSLIDGLSAMLKYQSDLEFLAKPPSGYLLAGVDLLGELKSLRSQVTSGGVSNEIDFEARVATILASAHDGHLTFQLDGLNVFGVGRLISLVSVSQNGTDTPQVYSYDDYYSYLNDTGAEPSAITQINGLDTEKFILALAENSTNGGFQDPDALYNSFIWSWNLGEGARNSPGLFSGFLQEPLDPWTNLTFANGTTTPYPNYATATGDFTGVVDGESFYSIFLNATNKASALTASATATAITATNTATATPTAVSQIIGYPTPETISEDGAASGYSINEPGFENVAVLSLRFMSETAQESFQDTLTQFLDTCRSQNKTHLVLDLIGNPGGTIALGYETLKQLFPTLEPYGAGNYRASDGFQLLGDAVTNISAQVMQEQPDNYTAFEAVGGTTVWAGDTYLNENGTMFTSFSEYYGPASAANGYGNYTELSRYDLANPQFDEAFGNIIISGYGNESSVAPQPFNNSNIIMLTDGQCSSTCTILAHFLKYQAKVKSVTLGGRPQTGAMQAVGGIKGSQVQPFNILYALTAQTYELIDNATAATWEGTSLETILELGEYLLLRTASAGATPSELSFNIRNNIVEGDTSLTPLQYVYEAADCRLFYQPRHIANITNIWVDAAAQAFGLNGTSVFSGCVSGSTGQASSLSGDATLFDGGKIENATEVHGGSESSSGSSGGSGSQNGAGVLQASSIVVLSTVLTVIAMYA